MVVDVGGDGDVVAPIHREVVRHVRGVRPDDRGPLFLALQLTLDVHDRVGDHQLRHASPLWEARFDSLMAGTPSRCEGGECGVGRTSRREGGQQAERPPDRPTYAISDA